MVARRRAAIDRDGGALDVARALGAQEQRQRRNVLGLAEPAHVALGQRLGAQLVDRSAQRRRALPAQLVLPLGVGIAGMNDVDVDIIAIAELREALKSSTMYPHTATELANALAVAGKREEAMQLLETVEYAPWKAVGEALVYTGLGEKDEAFRSLEKAIELRAPFIMVLKEDPRFDSLHGDPRFQSLLRRMNLPL